MDLRTGASIVGLLAVTYGFAVAFGPRAHQDAGFWRRFTVTGALLLLVAVVVLVGIPFYREGGLS